MKSLAHLEESFQSQYHVSKLHHAWVLEGITDPITVMNWIEKTISLLIHHPLNPDHFHPNLLWLKGETDHTVDAVRKAIQFMEKTSWEGGWKICVIENADLLNTHAQNALLKLVEEPPEQAIIFFTSQRIRSLLPTLYSRSLHFVFMENDTTIENSFENFFNRWILSIEQILTQKKYELLLQLQDELNEEGVHASIQSNWVFSAFKRLIDSYYMHEDHPVVKKINKLNHIKDLVERWHAAHLYSANALKFDLDQKHACLKLTYKLME